MYIAHGYIHVMAELIENFKSAAIENTHNSRLEPGIASFDLSQGMGGPAHFELIEVYRMQEDSSWQKETPHYKNLQDVAEPIMAQDHTRTIYKNIFPADQDW